MPLRRIATRFTVLLAAAALVPLVAFGTWALVTLQRSTRQSVIAANLAVAAREADDIAREVGNRARLLNALAANLQDVPLDRSERERMLEDFVLRFHELRELTLFDITGNVLASTRTGPSRIALPEDGAVNIEGASLLPPHVDEDMTLSTELAVPLVHGGQRAGWLAANVSLDDASHAVHRIRSGMTGYALLVDEGGRLLAHDTKDRVAGAADGLRVSHPLLRDGVPQWREYQGTDGERLLGVVASVPRLGWRLIIEQPTSDAFAASARIQIQLALAAFAALALTLVAGALAARRFVAPMLDLERATEALADGDFHTRVAMNGTEEFNRLAGSFNTMADRLVKLQDDIKSQERQVMFGRVVAGLFHDLSHPVQNIANSARLLLRLDLPEDARAAIQQTIERELVTLRHFMDDVLNVARPRPLDRFPVDVNATIVEVVEAMRAEWERSGVQVCGRCTGDVAMVDGDRFALGRVFRNLLANAIQATPRGGQVDVSSSCMNGRVEVRVSDTGAGISADRLATIFDDFVTTRRRGLGLGLATSRRIIEQLGGTIIVESEVGRGTTFTVCLPASAGHLAIPAAS